MDDMARNSAGTGISSGGEDARGYAKQDDGWSGGMMTKLVEELLSRQ